MFRPVFNSTPCNLGQNGKPCHPCQKKGGLHPHRCRTCGKFNAHRTTDCPHRNIFLQPSNIPNGKFIYQRSNRAGGGLLPIIIFQGIIWALLGLEKGGKYRNCFNFLCGGYEKQDFTFMDTMSREGAEEMGLISQSKKKITASSEICRILTKYMDLKKIETFNLSPTHKKGTFMGVVPFRQNMVHLLPTESPEMKSLKFLNLNDIILKKPSIRILNFKNKNATIQRNKLSTFVKNTISIMFQ